MSKKNIANKSEAAEEQIRELRKPLDFDTLEFPIEVIISKYDGEEPWAGEWFVPDYQRNFIWPETMQSMFIESVLLNVPIPHLFVAETSDGRLEIVDGSQRIRTLHSFCNDELELSQLTKLTKLNGFKFSDMTQAEQRKLKNRSLKAIKLSDKADEQIRKDIFNRINRSAELRDSEIRRGAFSGPYYDFVLECSKDALFRKVCPFTAKSTSRREPEEYVTRFLCYKDNYEKFRHDVRAFLDEIIIERNKDFKAKDFARDKTEFEKMLKFANAHLSYGFARFKGANTSARVRFEALSVGIILALRENPNAKPRDLSWLDSKEFADLTRSDGSNSGPRLRARIEFVKNNLLGM